MEALSFCITGHLVGLNNRFHLVELHERCVVAADAFSETHAQFQNQQKTHESLKLPPGSHPGTARCRSGAPARGTGPAPLSPAPPAASHAARSAKHDGMSDAGYYVSSFKAQVCDAAAVEVSCNQSSVSPKGAKKSWPHLLCVLANKRAAFWEVQHAAAGVRRLLQAN